MRNSKGSRPVLFRAVVVALLAVMLAGMFSTARMETPTWDEVAHLPHGYAYLKTGQLWFDQFHAALSRMLVGVPLLAVDPRVPTEHESWQNYKMLEYRRLFLYHNRVSPDRMILLGRCATMTVTIFFAIVLAVWTRRRFGMLASLCALSLFALDPNFLAFGKYTTTDMFTACVLFLSVLAWSSYVESGRLRYLLLSGLVVGVAMATKHSMAFLFGLLPLLYIFAWWQDPERRSIWRLTGAMAVLAVMSVAVVGLVYWPVTSTILFKGAYQPLVNHIDPATPMGGTMFWIAKTLRLPYHPYLMGFYYIGNAGVQGTPGYVLGELTESGRWYFFPLTLAVKSTSAFLAALAISIGAACGVLARQESEFSLKRIPFAWAAVVIPPAVYFAMCIPANMNSGVRHLLPMYPFLFVFIGAVMSAAIDSLRLNKARNAVLVALAALLVTESALAWPHYLAFFNTPAGGSSHGHEYLVNANLDWGQDVKKLKAHLDGMGVDEVCLSYHGQADVEYYGIRPKYLPKTAEREWRKYMDCVVAISVTNLVGVYYGAEAYSWLRELEPDARVGYSINIYDLRKAVR